MSLSKLPIQKLPFLALEKIYKSLQFVDLINLCQCSKRMQNYIIALEKTSKNEVTCVVSIRMTRRTIRLKRKGWDNFSWSSHSPRNRYTADANVFIDRVIEGRPWRVSPWTSGWMTMGINDEHLLFWFQFFKKVFNCRIVHLILECEWNVNFEQLFVDTDVLRKADKITVLPTVLKNEEMNFILFHFEAEELEMDGETREDYEYPEVISRFPKISLEEYFMTTDEVWLMMVSGTCKQMLLGNIVVDDERVKELIEKWLNSDNRTLETLVITDKTASYLVYGNILNGLNALPGAEKRRDAAEYYNSDIFYEDGRDIKRRDGLLATLNLVNTGRKKGLYFTVWYDADPNV